MNDEPRHSARQAVAADALLQTIVGMSVSQVWRGHGSAIFLEFGALRASQTRNARRPGFEGEASLMIEWSWRIERPRSILCGSWSDERRWRAAFARMLNATVMDAGCFGKLPEISIGLSNKLRVASFMTADGQPSWALIVRGLRCETVHVSGGRLAVERA